MKTRNELENSFGFSRYPQIIDVNNLQLIFEVLLDIRYLLTSRPPNEK